MVAVHSSEEVLKIMSMGYDNRTTFATASNVESSRSHCALSVYVVARNRFSGVETRGKLHLVDLAGSERVAKSGVSGDRLREAQAINKYTSLLPPSLVAPACMDCSPHCQLVRSCCCCFQVIVCAWRRHCSLCQQEEPHPLPQLYPYIPVAGLVV